MPPSRSLPGACAGFSAAHLATLCHNRKCPVAHAQLLVMCNRTPIRALLGCLGRGLCAAACRTCPEQRLLHSPVRYPLPTQTTCVCSSQGARGHSAAAGGAAPSLSVQPNRCHHTPPGGHFAAPKSHSSRRRASAERTEARQAQAEKQECSRWSCHGDVGSPW
jgi:hypothetical protein